MVIASTNRPFDLDEAVLRRLPRRIMVDLPDLKTRSEILGVTLANNRLAGDVNLTSVAESLEGYTGSDLKEICREAVVRVAHERESGSFSPADADTDDDDDDVEVDSISKQKRASNMESSRFEATMTMMGIMRSVNATNGMKNTAKRKEC